MAQPPYMYGHFPGYQQPPPNQPYNYQPPPNFPPPYLGTSRQPPSDTAGNYAMANYSYEQNANRIPGLAFGAPPPFPTPLYRPEVDLPWQQAPPATLPGISPPQAQPPTSFQPPPENGARRGHPTGVQTGSAPPRPATENRLEEGELSEGEFEDLYEPREGRGVSGARHEIRPPPQSSRFLEDRVDSASDADGSSLYNTGTPREQVVESTSTSMPAPEDEYSPDGDGQQAQPQRERSGSYSPYLSPSEVQRRASVNQITPGDVKSSARVQSGPVLEGKAATSTHAGLVSDSKSPFGSVPEAKKKAQEAILGLWPLKVRYQNYIDEGFDENLIRSLFTDLGLDIPTPKPNPPSNKPAGESHISSPKPVNAPPATNLGESHTTGSSSSKSANLPNTEPTGANLTKDSAIDNNADEAKMADKAAKSAAEERKDKIARKLAAKAQKTTAGPTRAAASQPTVPVATIPTPVNTAVTSASSAAANSPASVNTPLTKTKPRAENNALLHQKLAALKKKEQEKAAAAAAARAEKDAATLVPATEAAPTRHLAVRTNSNIPTPTDQLQCTSSINSPEAPSTTADSVRRSESTQPQAQPQSASKDGIIPGISLPAAQLAQTKFRNLKRPVAADFDNTSSHPSTLKRTRTQETLIIDVSDDEDVEMDIGSPTEGLTTSINTANPPGNHTPLAAYPPLSDTPGRKQRSSPDSPAVQTPEKAGKLDLLHGRIEEMKRKIAEAEAKKKSAKKLNGPQTPSAQPSPSAEPARLPKLSDSKREPRKSDIERRDRIASLDLPAVEAALKEKREKLKELVSQAAQLELDVQAAEAERLKLTNEMKQLEEPSEENSTGSSGQSPPPVDFSIPDETRTPASFAQTPTFTEPLGASTEVPTAIATNSEQEDVEMNTVDTPSESDSCIDASQPDSSLERNREVREPSPKPHLQSAAPVQADTGTANGVTEDENRISHVASLENTAKAAAEPSNLEGGEKESQDSTDTDISMQTSEAESSDDESYEPQPAQISDNQRAGPESGNVFPSPSAQVSSWVTDEQKDEQVVDKDPSEPSPVQIDVPAVKVGLEDIRGEVVPGSSQPHCLLTIAQPGEKTKPAVEDLLSYHSPLEYFRAYRLHPRFLEAVPGGLKSTTYSCKIDPKKEICPHALAGDRCPDGNACKFQHFENMMVPDGEIITQLGSSDMFSGEMKLRFIEGLKKVLNELKANKVKDFDRITKAIVEFRAAFLGDKTKVLPLDGVTI
ncbi:hypothetical protein DL765_010060 [Monosporascus sp. GIB2]|nr:hypothetical protein DL765_010060 [Monosporascus sp. GIB2]